MPLLFEFELACLKMAGRRIRVTLPAAVFSAVCAVLGVVASIYVTRSMGLPMSRDVWVPALAGAIGGGLGGVFLAALYQLAMAPFRIWAEQRARIADFARELSELRATLPKLSAHLDESRKYGRLGVVRLVVANSGAAATVTARLSIRHANIATCRSAARPGRWMENARPIYELPAHSSCSLEVAEEGEGGTKNEMRYWWAEASLPEEPNPLEPDSGFHMYSVDDATPVPDSYVDVSIFSVPAMEGGPLRKSIRFNRQEVSLVESGVLP